MFKKPNQYILPNQFDFIYSVEILKYPSHFCDFKKQLLKYNYNIKSFSH